ncbi:MAG TPA: hypothetical protein VGF15_07755 [Solirubrobacteraceae bacterium]
MTIDPAHRLSAISCASMSLCVAVDQSGDALFSNDPAATSPSWSTPAPIDPGQKLLALSCASAALCVAVDSAGAELTSTDPAGGAGTWQRIDIDGAVALTGVSCVSAALCVAVDQAGNVSTSTDPAASSPHWSTPASVGPGHLQAVSCSSESLCVAVDGTGNALMSANPASPSPSWGTQAIDPARSLITVSCTVSGMCVALDSLGRALVSANPASSTPTWSSTQIDLAGVPAAVSCTPGGLCVEIDGSGNALLSDDPSASTPSWSESGADPGGTPTGISCLAQGFCGLIDASGNFLRGLVGPPLTSTTAASTITSSEATLTANVDPNDALLEDCRFEYGLSTQYGESIPCASLPLPSTNAQSLIARVSNLLALSTYHYRILATNAGGTSTGLDQTFTTSAAVTIVHPSPSIAGVPAMGERLRCLSGISSTATVSLTYAWLRDSSTISGAKSSTYTIVSTDAKHHLQCRVSATDVAGSATAYSPFVAVPAQGVLAAVGETLIGKAQAANHSVTIPIQCSAQAAGSCTIELRLTVIETRRAKRVIALASAFSSTRHVTVTLATARVQMAPGQRRTIALSLNSTGVALLKHWHRLPVRLSVSGTIIGAIRASLSQQRLTLGAVSAHSGRRGRRR